MNPIVKVRGRKAGAVGSFSVREVRVSYRKIKGRHEDVSGIREPEQVAQLFRRLQWNNVQEQVMLFCLDGAHCVVSASTVFVGSANSSVIHPRELFQIALLCGACAIVIAHNHPSGALLPSSADREVTERVKRAGELLGIPLLDHVIVWEGALLRLRWRVGSRYGMGGGLLSHTCFFICYQLSMFYICFIVIWYSIV